MSTTALPTSLPNEAQIADYIRALTPGLTLYRGATEWYTFQYAGTFYHIPPHLPGEPEIVHPAKRGPHGASIMVRADGTLTVHDRYGTYKKDIFVTPGTPADYSTETIEGDLPGEAARNIAIFATSRHGEFGVVLLTGNAERDAVVKGQSKRLVLAAKRAQDVAHVEAFRERLSNWEKDPNKAKRVRPKPTFVEKAAQQRLDDAQAEGETVGVFLCSFGCAVETNDWDEYARHMLRAHREKAVPPAMLASPENVHVQAAPASPEVAAGPSTNDEPTAPPRPVARPMQAPVRR
jgi:hypothetical protein